MKVLDKPTKHLFSVDEYYQMAAAGIFHEDSRVELIEGEIIEMVPIGGPHARVVDRMTAIFAEALNQRAFVRVQNPIRLSQDSEPQPDVVLVRPNFYSQNERPHPGPQDVFLVIEVADTTASYDRKVKGPLYAVSGICEYWLVDLRKGSVDVCRRPGPEGYGEIVELGRDDQLNVQAFPDIVLKANDLFG